MRGFCLRTAHVSLAPHRAALAPNLRKRHPSVPLLGSFVSSGRSLKPHAALARTHFAPSFLPPSTSTTDPSRLRLGYTAFATRSGKRRRARGRGGRWRQLQTVASMDLGRRETDPGTALEFVVLDIRGGADSSEANEELTGERERKGDASPPSTGVLVGVHEKPVIDGSPREHLVHHPSTPTAGGAKRRRAGRRVPAGWRDPRKILFVFAALSSVGTLILLYFTLSMGKMSSGQGDGE